MIDSVIKIDSRNFNRTSFARKYKSERLGSGGKLFIIENVFISSVSDWRRVDWLVIAQFNFFSRLWMLNDGTSPVLDELKNLFDYRHWKARFQKLDGEYCMLKKEWKKIEMKNLTNLYY